jgi:hypothetical protein
MHFSDHHPLTPHLHITISDRTTYCAAMYPRLFFIQVLVTCLFHRAMATDQIQLLTQASQALLEILGCPLSLQPL